MDAIGSAEKYKGNNYEIIIINDGSTEPETLDILKNLEQKGYFIINQKNLGLATARNNAIKISKGKYILPLDADNKIKPQYITKSIKILDENPDIGIVYSDLRYFGKEKGIRKVPDFDFSLLLAENFIDACAIFRKQVWEDVKGYDPKLDKLVWEDWEFWLNTAKKGWKFFHIPEVLFYYRKKTDSMALKAHSLKLRNKVYDHILFQKHSEIFYLEYKKLYLRIKKLRSENIKLHLDNKKIHLENKKINKFIDAKDNQIVNLNHQIQNIQHSITWNILTKINKITEFIFPFGTKRRNTFNLCVTGTQVLIIEGWKSFLKKHKEYKESKKRTIKKNQYLYFQRREEEKKNKNDEIKNEIKNFKYKPKISIIVPTWNTQKDILKQTISSVCNQLYPNWELCIADGNSKSEIKNILMKYEQQDKRIKLKLLNENKGISENSNQALSLATGEFIGLLDHDDELTNDALYEVVKLLQKHSDADLIYSDEDKIDLKGKRLDFFFKPDWSPDLLLSQNYVSHFGIYRKKIVDKINGFRKGYEGSQDYDLILRFSEQTNNIYHIPEILYHWKVIPGSVASNPNAKGYAYIIAKKALKDAMERRKIPIECIEYVRYPGHYRIKYKIIENNKVSIIIPTKDNQKLLKKCINSILQKTEYENYEILIINNQSKKYETLEYFREIEDNARIRIINYNKPFNYSAMNNYAVKFVKGTYILFLNDDTEIISNKWINAMMEHCQKKNVGAVGAKLLYANNTIQHAGVILGIGGVAGHSHKFIPNDFNGYFLKPHLVQNVSALTGACLMIKKSLFKEVNGFDEKNLPISLNDIDLCLKIRRKGYLIVYTPFAELYHHESVSRGYDMNPQIIREIEFMKSKWKKNIKRDPYYNPNLSLDKEDFSFRL